MLPSCSNSHHYRKRQGENFWFSSIISSFFLPPHDARHKRNGKGSPQWTCRRIAARLNAERVIATGFAAMHPSRAADTNASGALAFQRSGIAPPPRYGSTGGYSSAPAFAPRIISAWTPEGLRARKCTAPMTAGEAAVAGIRTVRADGPSRSFIVSPPGNTPTGGPGARAVFLT